VSEGIGKRIIQAYEEAGLNRHQFAQRLGTTYSNVLRWEKGETQPKGPYLTKIAELTGVTIAWLMSGDESLKGKETRLERDDGPSDATKALLQRYFEGRGKDLSLAVKGALVDACRRLGEPKDERDLDDMARVLARGFELRAEQQPPTEEELQGYIYVGPKKPKG
jgi:transcriptional regulator with XRE-family HTH domain